MKSYLPSSLNYRQYGNITRRLPEKNYGSFGLGLERRSRMKSTQKTVDEVQLPFTGNLSSKGCEAGAIFMKHDIQIGRAHV